MTTPSFRMPRITMSGPLGVSLLALGLAVLFVISAVISILSTALSGGAGNVEPEQEIVKLQTEHKDMMATWQSRFNGRSIFYKPPPKPIVAQPVVQRPVEPRPVEQPKPTIPATYQGPSLIYMIGDECTFRAPRVNEKPFTVRVGQEKHGVKVLSTKGAWTVRLGFGGGEYDVPIFASSSDEPFFKSNPRPNVLHPGILVEATPPSSGPGAVVVPASARTAVPPAVEDEDDDEGDDSPPPPDEDDEKEGDEKDDKPPEVRKGKEPVDPSLPEPSPPSF